MGIGSIVSNFVNPARIGPLGGGPLGLGFAARQLVSSFGQSLIQKVGDLLNVPQPAIDAAQSAFALSTGDIAGGVTNAFEAGRGFAQAAGGSESDATDFGRQIEDAIRQAAADIAGGPEAKEAKSGGKGGSWLMAMARALGEKADKLAGEMQDMADKMAADKSDPSASLEFSAKSQEFGLFMNSASNALKTAGESLTTVARKGG